ncbi:longevity assurance proteins LAG1/LAC1 [Exidia glandulosa HHB12029]|uniref:Longevity assurance proteins LAG1/LAC1 n=1 Tax=Exidia glandulosa HHB12029 TaxID=1314781 RepID=A0A165QXR6_EXIGL|nr:longevity assurance proteins LAG1/LAC1 [Exidia glandulosa HHB12029]
MSSLKAENGRERAGSIQKALHDISETHTAVPASLPENGKPATVAEANARRRRAAEKPYDSGSLGLVQDVLTMRWMRVPESSLKLLLIPVLLWANWELVSNFMPLPIANPFSRLLFIDHPEPTADGLFYRKGYNDLWFIAYWVIVMSFIRLFWTVYVFHPLARHYGIHNEGKVIRFGEQGYAVVYFTVMGSFGLHVMSQLPTWYFNCTPQWTDYPQWKMTPALKSYYLLHSAYWLQQFLVLVLRLEKPRKDFTELVIHHYVTLWLIGWSYLVNLTWIGNLVYMTMDWSDVFIALAKCLNYLSLDTLAAVAFGWFALVWSYTRHWLNIYLLYSVWTEFHKVPKWAQKWSPEEGVWMPEWMRYQIWIPIMLLQIVNLFWYFRIWRILYRAVFLGPLADERSDDEDESEPDAAAVKKDQ